VDTGGPPRQALVGAAIAGFFGGLWAVWGAGGLDGAARATLIGLGVVLGLAVAVSALVLASRARRDVAGRGSMFASRAYRVIVVVEVVAIITGVASAVVLLGAGARTVGGALRVRAR
jgi:hypothetical protein